MTPKQKKALVILALVSTNLYWMYKLGKARELLGWILDESLAVADITNVLVDKVMEVNPEILEDPKIDALLVLYQFNGIMRNFND